MSNIDNLRMQYIIDDKCRKTSVILPIAEFTALLEEMEELAQVINRREEPVVAHDELIKEFRDVT